MDVRAHLSSRPRTIVIVAAAAVLTWLVVSRSFAAFLADAAPAAALWLDSHQPQALVNLADQSVGAANAAPPRAADISAAGGNQAADGRTLDRAFAEFETVGRNQSIARPLPPHNEQDVRRWATAALMSDPLNARALRILGQLAEADGNDADTLKFMQAAARLSLHETVAAYWLMRNGAVANNYRAAVHYADILLRTNPQLDKYVVPVLGQISGDKDGASLLKTVIARNPPWREQFMSELPYNARDARTSLDLLLALRADAEPPTADEIQPYLKFLVDHKFYGLAYYTWLQFLPQADLRHAGLLFNGDFEGAPSGMPFDWTITPGPGVTVDVVPRPDNGGHALMVDFQYGRVDYHSVTELVMLAPGTYQFDGEYKGSLVGPRGMKWRVVCADSGTVTSGGESQMILGTTQNWQKVSFTFTVPDTGCPAQYVRLDLDARMASEQLVSGSVLFDDLQISRVARPATSGG